MEGVPGSPNPKECGLPGNCRKNCSKGSCPLLLRRRVVMAMGLASARMTTTEGRTLSATLAKASLHAAIELAARDLFAAGAGATETEAGGAAFGAAARRGNS